MRAATAIVSALVLVAACTGDGAMAGRDASAGFDASRGGRDAGPSAGDAARPDARTAIDATSPAADAGGAPCGRAGLVWRSANKTTYESYPDPGSPECVEFSGCKWAGMFAACDDVRPETWVMTHNIAAAFPDFDTLQLHDLCLRSGSHTMVVTVLDTCGDADCSGCCTENLGSADELIDLESYTNTRWGLEDGAIEWADLGPTTTAGCD